jgi:hypothetical protein
MNKSNSDEVCIYGFEIYIHIMSQHVIIKNKNFCKMQIFYYCILISRDRVKEMGKTELPLLLRTMP